MNMALSQPQPPAQSIYQSRIEPEEPMVIPETPSRQIENTLFQDNLSDLKIVCEDREFPVHKCILSVRSDVFKAMFSSFNEDKLKIEDTNAKTMETFLRFLYTDSFNCCKNIDCNLLILADKYNVKELVQKCVQVLEKNMNCDNVLEIAFSAYLINNQKLIDKASEFIYLVPYIKQGEVWEELKSKNPDVASKVMSLLRFGNLK